MVEIRSRERGERRPARAGRDHGGAIASGRRSWAIRRSGAPNSKRRTLRASGDHRDSPRAQKRRVGGLGEGVRRETAGGGFLFKFDGEVRGVETEREYREELGSFFTSTRSSARGCE